MNLTKRELMLLIHSIVTSVATLEISSNGVFGKPEDLIMIEQAEAFVNDVLKEQPYMTFTEFNELFTKLVKQALGETYSEDEIDLANLPSTEYIQ